MKKSHPHQVNGEGGRERPSTTYNTNVKGAGLEGKSRIMVRRKGSIVFHKKAVTETP